MLTRVPFPSPNYSSRGGATVRTVVLHTAEGARTIESLGSFFANPAAEVSSHAGADDKPNQIGVYVRRGDKAWTAASFNPVAVQLELCGFAAWSPSEWEAHPNMLANAAAWIAEEAAAFGIPIRRLSPAEAQGGATGVCQHIDLGAAGGGHVDCGPGFPMDRVLQMAAGGPPSHPASTEELMPLTCTQDRDGNLVVYGVDERGHLWEVTTKAADPSTPMTKTYRWSDLTANGQNGQVLAKT